MRENLQLSGPLRLVLLATLSAILAYRLVGSVVSSFVFEFLFQVQDEANEVLDLVVFVTNFASIILTMFLLRWARSNTTVRLFRENERLLTGACAVSVVIAVQLLADFLFTRLEWLFYVPISNYTQIDFHDVVWRLVLLGVTPSVLGLYFILNYAAGRNSVSRDTAG